jgi:hypothetical protein
MQGLEIPSATYGNILFWEGVIAWFDAPTRQLIYAAKHARGDTHCGLQLSGAYREPNQFYQNFPGVDWTNDLAGFHAMLEEIIQAGFFPWIPLAGDGLTPDAEGKTYGYSWLMNNLQRIVDAIRDLVPYCLFSPGYDGIIGYDERTQSFGPWTPMLVDDYLVTLRAIAPNCYSSIEPSAGPLNGTLPKFISPAAYDALDAILNETTNPPNSDVTWQGAARLLGPAYVRPADQPSGDDPGAPFGPNDSRWSCRVPTSRGPIYGCAFEWATYDFVRGHITPAQVDHQRAYLLGCGYSSTG